MTLKALMIQVSVFLLSVFLANLYIFNSNFTLGSFRLLFPVRFNLNSIFTLCESFDC